MISDDTAAPVFRPRLNAEMVALVDQTDWSTTSLGARANWSPSLTLAVGIVLASGFPMALRWGPDFVLLYNDGYIAFLGDKHPRALGLPGREAWSEVWRQIEPVHLDILSGRQGAVFNEDVQLSIRRRAGVMEAVHFTVGYSPAPDPTAPGGIGGIFVTAVETTQAVKAKKQVDLERKQLAQMFEQGPSFMALLEGPEHRFQFVNPSYNKVVGGRRVVGLTVAEALPEAVEQGFLAILDRVFLTGESYSVVGARYAMAAEPGGPVRERFLDFIYQPLKDVDGQVTGIFVEGIDVSDRKAADVRRDALARLTEQIRDLKGIADISFTAGEILGEALAVSRVGYGTVDPRDDSFTVERDWNAPGVASIAGVLNLRDFGSFVVDLKAGRFIAISDVRDDARTHAAAGALEERSARSFVNVPVVENDETVAVLYVNNAEVRHWSAVDLDFIKEFAARTRTAIERARSVLALERSEQRLRELNEGLERESAQLTVEKRAGDRIFELSRDLQAVATFDGFLKVINPSWSRQLGRTDEFLLATPFAEIIHPDDLAVTGAVVAALQRGEPVHQFHVRLLKADGSPISFAWSAVPEGGPGNNIFYTIGRDITDDQAAALELQAAQEALRQAQKMEAVGQLTGGIAHDFNNLLAGITGSLDLVGRRIAEGRMADVDRYITAAQSSARRAASLTQRLLAFSRRQTLDPRPTDANKLVANMSDLIRRSVGPAVAVEVVEAGGLWTTLIDPSQLENALLNLSINARDAMPDGGRITIETANKWLDHRAAKERDLSPGQYISICVTDSGTGMTPDVVARAFDPFFTTKPIGQGTGLGLSMVHGFVRQSGGQVRIYTEAGAGTTVCLYLPRYVGKLDAPEASPDALAPEASGRGEAVLVIDDEAILRMLMVDVLEEAGYRVLEAGDGPSGLHILNSDARIDLLITDVGLPNGMNGRQVADAARTKRPDLKVLFVTGYAENAVVGNGHLESGMAVITKPFEINALAARVRDIIEG